MRIVPYIVGTLILLGAVCVAAILSGVPPLWMGLVGSVVLIRGLMGATGADSDTRFEPPSGNLDNPE